MVNIMSIFVELNEVFKNTIGNINEDKIDPHTSNEVDKWGAQQYINKYGTKVSRLLCEEVDNDKSIEFNKELVRVLKGCRKMTHNKLIEKIINLNNFAIDLVPGDMLLR